MNPAILAMDDSSQSESEWNILTPLSASDLPDAREKVIVSVDDNVPASQRTEVGDLVKERTAPPTPAINLRAYQQEMLNQSLKKNVIVAMDTGSGKTQVAILRIRAELEKSSPGKIIWFMAPTVSLCAQQYDSISRQIRSAKIRLLTGNLNLHTWQPSTWDVILNDVQVVISTFQILLHALEHAFIKMNRLSLLVFDEAHHCVKKHAGSKIMKDYYLRDKNDGVCVPSILGLTASPSMRSDKQGLLMLEATMDARCISPTIHREELIKHANRPQISRIEYSPPVDAILTHSMRSLQSVYHGLDIEDDPHVTYLRREPDEKYLRRAQTAIEKKDTFCQNQLKGLSGRALELSSALGPWAADRYLWKAIDSFLSRIGTSHAFFDQWMNEEKRYLSRVLQEVAVGSPPVAPQNESVLSEKVKLLAAELIQAQGEVLGIVFVKERATVTMLMEVLNTFEPIRQRFRIGAVVGDSNFAGRKKDVYDFAADMDSEVLQKFRAGTINLLIATSVLEEGIDVPACNLVICFDQPATPKSFIQRRGRARMQDSRFVLFFERQKSNIDKWLNLEEEMKKFYQDEQREAQRLAELEEAEGPGISSFVVKSTGATLNFDNAKQLLEHFCSKLFRGEFVDNRPDYIIEKYEGDDPCRPRLRATVILPSHLPVGLRKAHGASIWFSEKNATKDVAFHAYLTLYKAGFVNDHLLPFEPGEFSRFDRRPATVEAYAQLDPWAGVARSWKQAGMKWIYELSHYDGGGNELGQYQVLIPEKVGLPEPMQLYLDHAATSMICFTSVHEATIAEESTFRDDTSTLLALHYSHRWDVENRDHVIKIKALGHTLDRKQMGADGFDETNEDVRNGQYLIRDHFGTPYTFESIIPSKPPIEEVQKPFRFYADAPEDVPYLVLKKWTRRSDFFHPVVEGQAEPCATKPYGWVVPMAWARVDKMPAKLAAFGMLIPHVIHEFEVMLLTKRLINTALKPLQITNHGLVREAISSRSARGPCDYERLELLGDSLLKYCTAVHVFTEYTHWHEGYLSFKKDSIVSNAKLCQDSINSGLAKFIISQAFTGQKWRPLHLDSFTQPKGSRLAERLLSTKTLADVVEALIGAAHVEGGMEKALDCISLFIRDVNWQDMKLRGKSVNDGFSEDAGLPQDLAPVEDLLGYTFKKKDLLVEAMTHASYMSDTDHRSLDRLEFLGDAVLDYVVVTKLFSVKPALQNHHMHLLKTATVNGEFLAFINLEHGLRRKEAVVTIENEISTMDKKLSLWQFMRHGSSAIGVEQDGAVKRHDLLRNDIATALMTGRRYPWALLARLRPRKFFSDMIEALLGAVWIDSGCLLQCEKTLDHLGIMAYLNRFIQDNVHIMHPKEELVVLAGDETVTYDIHIHNKTGEVDNEAEYSCRVLVGDRLIAEVDGGISNYEVQVKAAEEAVRVLTEETQSSAMDLS